MHCVVSGFAGFIGSHLVRALTHAGHTVIGIDDFSAARPATGIDFISGIDFVKGDVADRSVWDQVDDRVDVVFHLAASFANERSLEHPDSDARSNIIGTIEASHFAARLNARLIYAGSSSSYGAWTGRPFVETDPLAPATPYALSKSVGEQYATMLCKGSVTARLFNVYGPGDPPGPYRNALPNMIAAAVRTGRLTVYGEDSTRDFTHVDDVVRVLCAMIRPDFAGKTVNVCTGIETRVLDIARQIAGLTDARVDVQPRRAWDTCVRRCGDSRLLRSIFPLTFHTLHDALPSLVEDVQRQLSHC
jgi:UDP-glucose 4-epimerase